MSEPTSIQQDKELINILEPHYWNLGFKEGAEAQNAVINSLTYKRLLARDKELARKAEYAARFDELLTAAHNSDDILNNGYYESRCNELRKLQGQSNGEKQ